MLDEKTLAHKIHEIMKGQINGGGGHLRKVVVRCDSTEPIDNAIINAHWRQIAVEPVFAASYIEVHSDPPFGKCLVCNQEFELNSDTSRCPYCHCEQFKIIHGPPAIETYEMEPQENKNY